MNNFKTAIVTSLIAIISFSQAHSQKITAKEIIKIADEKNRGISSKGTMSMTIVRPKWERTIVMKNWSKGDDNLCYIYLNQPKKKDRYF